MSAPPVASILTPLEDLLTHVLTWFHETLGLPWAWAIVALVILVRILLVPVAVKQIHSMQNLQAHMPEMKRIQEQWKHDRQRQNEELTRFYRENKVNPAASCLPMVFQLPIFFSLYYVLRDFEKDIFPKFQQSSLDFLGLVDITDPITKGWGPLLIVVYVASQVTSSYYMSTSMQRSQRILMIVLPVFFVWFIIFGNFPAGLMIYWLTTNLWATGQGVVTKQMIPRADPEAFKRTSRTPPKDPPVPAGGRAPAGGKQTALPASSGASAGPPRRVKRKRSGGGGRSRR